MILSDYMKPRQRAILARVPIHYLEQVKMLYKKSDVKIRYRGPRNTPNDFGRSRASRASTCLKVNATHFSVYHQL